MKLILRFIYTKFTDTTAVKALKNRHKGLFTERISVFLSKLTLPLINKKQGFFPGLIHRGFIQETVFCKEQKYMITESLNSLYATTCLAF